MITVSKREFDRQVIPETSPDASYLEQEGFEDRLAEYRRGDFHFVGVRAAIELQIPNRNQGYYIQRLESPGLWGIESDSGEDYFNEVFIEEKAILADMLEELGVKVVD